MKNSSSLSPRYDADYERFARWDRAEMVKSLVGVTHIGFHARRFVAIAAERFARTLRDQQFLEVKK